MTVAAIVGSAFESAQPSDLELEPIPIATRLGTITLHRVHGRAHDAFVLFRHGAPHRLLPNQIPYKAHALALSAVGCRALLARAS